IEETKLKNEILLNSIHLLMLKRIIICDNWSYSIDQDYAKAHYKEITSYQQNISEIKELIGSAIEYSIEKDDKSFKINKTSVTQKDFMIIQGLLSNIDDILKNSNTKSLGETFVFYWGYGNYQSVIH